MGRIFGRSLALFLASFTLAACQSPDVMVATLSPPAKVQIPPTSFSDIIPASTAMPAGAIIEAPSGFIAFCHRDPGQCADTVNGASVLVLDASVWRSLELVNAAWNTSVKPLEDAAHYGRVDYWTIPRDGYGDCDDYVLGKRMSLIELGFPSQALKMATVRTANGVAHAVLTVTTDRGDYVLDNRVADILPWTLSEYTWISRQSPGRIQWATIGPAQADRQMAAVSSIVPRPN